MPKLLQTCPLWIPAIYLQSRFCKISFQLRRPYYSLSPILFFWNDPKNLEWPLYKGVHLAVCWLQIKSSATVWTSSNKVQLSLQCQQKDVQMDHPVILSNIFGTKKGTLRCNKCENTWNILAWKKSWPTPRTGLFVRSENNFCWLEITSCVIV